MWIEDALAEMRSQLRAQLPDRAFLRRDRGEDLFVSNAPVFAPSVSEIPDFCVRREGALLHISPDVDWLLRLERQPCTPPDHFCESLRRFCGESPTPEAMRLFIRGAKLADAGASADTTSLALFDRTVRQHAALALRSGAGGGTYALALLDFALHARAHPAECAANSAEKPYKFCLSKEDAK